MAARTDFLLPESPSGPASPETQAASSAPAIASPLLPREPSPKPAFNPMVLREEGLAHLRKLAGVTWTDHNAHDPGITLLEVLCFALTDLTYRTSHPMVDLLAPPPHPAGGADEAPEPNPPPEPPSVYTAAEVLPCSPVSAQDFRKLIIDTPSVKNAWVVPAESTPQILRIAVDKAGQKLRAEPPHEDETDLEALVLHGLYVIYLELEQDEVLGDLNDARIPGELFVEPRAGDHFEAASLRVELEFIVWADASGAHPIDSSDYSPGSASWNLVDSVKDRAIVDARFVEDDDRVLTWSAHFKATAEEAAAAEDAAAAEPGPEHPGVPRLVALNFTITPREAAYDFGIMKEAVQALLQADGFRILRGWIDTYLAKLERRREVVANVLAKLHAHRNLCEDFLYIRGLDVEEIALCVDLEVEPYADVERIMAELVYQTERYLAPDVVFLSMDEALSQKGSMSQVFNGPLLEHGFIQDESLDRPAQREFVYGSDIVNYLMDIGGVVAVRSLVLANYVNDVVIQDDVQWELRLESAKPDNHRVPRFSLAKSRIRFLTGLVPRALDMTLVEAYLDGFRAANRRPKLAPRIWDVEPPRGTYRHLSAYTSIQWHLPLVYGLGWGKLGDSVPPERSAQARQLGGYLLVFEQVLADFLSQLDHVKDLLSVRARLGRGLFAGSLLGVPDVTDLLRSYEHYSEDVDEKAELPHERDRRENALLDHLLARFGEDLSDFAQAVRSTGGEAVLQEMVTDKAEFLADCPVIEHDRSRGLDYRDAQKLDLPGNVSGLKKRLRRLVDKAFWDHTPLQVYQDHQGRWRFRVEWSTGDIVIASTHDYPTHEAALLALERLIELGDQPASYRIEPEDVLGEGEYFTIRDPQAPGTGLLAKGTDRFAPGSAELDALLDRLQRLFRLYAGRPESAPVSILEQDDVRIHVYVDNGGKWRFRVVKHDEVHPERQDRLLRSAMAYDSETEVRAAVERLFRIGTDRDHYSPSFEDASADSGPPFRFNLLDWDERTESRDHGRNLALGNDPFLTREAREGSIRLLMRYFDRIPFRVVEHILLRPRNEDSPMVSVCFDESCSVRSQWDPYSFRVSVVLPSWPARMRHMEFRRYLERFVHMEVPAHVSVKICWVNRRQMSELDTAFRTWAALCVTQPVPPDVYNQALGNLLDALGNLTSVYPVATLHDCRSPGGPNPVVLGHTQLGELPRPNGGEP